MNANFIESRVSAISSFRSIPFRLVLALFRTESKSPPIEPKWSSISHRQ